MYLKYEYMNIIFDKVIVLFFKCKRFEWYFFLYWNNLVL